MTKRVALLANLTSGAGRHSGSADAVIARLTGAGFTVGRLQAGDADSAAEAARQCVQQEYDVLAVLGGDGTIHRVLPALAYSATALGVIPVGTGNDVARSLGLPLGNPLRAADLIIGGATRVIDLARVGAAYYATVLASGFDSLVNERANAMRWPRGPLRYTLATALELGRLNPLPFTLELDGTRRSVPATLVAVGNTASYGGGLRMCQGALSGDGMLDVVIIKALSKLELLRVYPRLLKGTHVTHSCYEHHLVRRVRLAASGIVAYADGERLAELPLTVEVAPQALTVVVPSS